MHENEIIILQLYHENEVSGEVISHVFKIICRCVTQPRLPSADL
jgi:hypothetical protein